MGDNVIGEGEFGRFCTMLDGRLADLGEKIGSVDSKVTEGFRRTNGRLDKAEARLTDVEKRGCNLMPAHKAMIETLAGREPLSKPKQAGVIAAISGVVVGLLELARTVIGHFLK